MNILRIILAIAFILALLACFFTQGELSMLFLVLAMFFGISLCFEMIIADSIETRKIKPF